MSDKERSQNFTNFRYFKPKNHYSPKVAFKIDVDHNKKIIKFSYAICSSNDNFSRKIARAITTGRMEAGDVISGKYDCDKTLVENVKEISNNLVERMDSADFKDDRKTYNDLNLLHESLVHVEMEKKFELMEPLV